ncbi:MAG: N-acetylmuramoyl-L-alanine amidase [Desulfonauticus sp.]|nr:N-acetylmuramoyl-L-alanine amidase [Desulfonauticus sp.]
MSRRKALLLLGSSCVSLLSGVAGASSGFDLGLQGQEFLAKGKFKEAIKVLQEAVKIEPNNEWLWGLLGRAYFQLKDMRAALSSFRKVLSLNPEDTYSRMMIDIISQKPLPPRREEKKKKLTPLEKKALEEERRIFAKLASKQGLGYNIKRIVLDPGHGGFDSGAVGLHRLEEKNVNLDVAKRTAQILNQYNSNLKIFFTRTEDYFVPLSARTTTANQYCADLFVSFHVNANRNRKPRGMETYFCSERASSKEAARVAKFENSVLKLEKTELVQKGYVDIEQILFLFERKRYWEAGGKVASYLQSALKKDLPLKNRGVHSANFYVLRRAKMPSILLELGFISNPEEERLLSHVDFRHKLAYSVAKGILALQNVTI